MNDTVNRIVELLEKNNMTAKELTERLSLNKSTVSEWKNGKTKPSIEAVIGISQIFEVSLDWLLVGQNTNSDVLYSDIEEMELVKYFRQLTEKERMIVLERARTILDLK